MEQLKDTGGPGTPRITREILRWKFSSLRMTLATLRLVGLLDLRARRRYDPNQPRIPRGQPEGGQWTSPNGGNQRRIAPIESLPRYSVNLMEEEARGGHAIRDHVGKSDAYLLAVVRAQRAQSYFLTIAKIGEGSFFSVETANDFVNRTLVSSRGVVDLVATGQLKRAVIVMRFGFATGKEAFRPDADAKPYIRKTYEVAVDIRHDPNSPRGYTVISAYPRNDWGQRKSDEDTLGF